MINLLSFSIVLLFLQPCYCLETLPVLVVDTGGVSVMGANIGNPFNKITNKVFSEMVKVIVSKASLTLIFVHSELSIEDLTKKDSHGSPFKAFMQEMINDKKLLYLPSVIDPYNTLTSLLPPNNENVLDLATAKQKAKEFSSSHIYIKFEPSQPTVERLRIHDLAMRSIVRSARSNNNGSLVAFYTGMNNPLVIEKRRYPKIKNIHEKSILVASKKVLFRLSVEFELTGVRGFKQVDQAAVVKEEIEEKSKDVGGHDKLSTTLSFTPFDLQFNFQLRKKDWILDDITLIEAGEKVGHTKIGVGAPWRSSYHCAETMKIVNTRDQSAVILKRYQWQPSRESCELTTKGCEDKNSQRSRFKLPIGTIKDFKKHKEVPKTKINADDEYLDEKDTWGFKKQITTKLYDYEALYEAEGDHKAHEETEKGSFGNHKHPSNKHKKKHTVNKYIDGDDGEHKANEDAVADMLDQTNKFDTNKNEKTTHGFDPDHESSEDTQKDPFGQKKLYGNKNVNSTQNSHVENKVDLDAKNDDIGHKKQYSDKNIEVVINAYGEHKADGETIKDSFGDGKQPSNKYIDDEHKKNKQEGKGQFDNNKISKDIGGITDQEDTDKENEDNIKNKFKKPASDNHYHHGIKDTHQGNIYDKNRDDSSGVQTVASNETPKGQPQSGTPPVKPSQPGTLPGKPSQSGQQSTGSTNASLPTQDLQFGSSVNCGPFFNHEILSCLLITFVILIMLFYGLEIMLNLQANDRFDNFGGKNFSITEEK